MAHQDGAYIPVLTIMMPESSVQVNYLIVVHGEMVTQIIICVFLEFCNEIFALLWYGIIYQAFFVYSTLWFMFVIQTGDKPSRLVNGSHLCTGRVRDTS